jgi:hypothetical protein
MAVTNYSATPNSTVLIICLLEPLNSQQIIELKPMADYFETHLPSMPKSRANQWMLMPLGLWKLRCGDYDAAIHWCERGLAQKARFPACEADLHLILAMAYDHCGRTAEACSHLEQGRQPVEIKLRAGLERGRGDVGYWFDWVYASLLLHEAAGLIDCSSVQPEND